MGGLEDWKGGRGEDGNGGRGERLEGWKRERGEDWKIGRVGWVLCCLNRGFYGFHGFLEAIYSKEISLVDCFDRVFFNMSIEAINAETSAP